MPFRLHIDYDIPRNKRLKLVRMLRAIEQMTPVPHNVHVWLCNKQFFYFYKRGRRKVTEHKALGDFYWHKKHWALNFYANRGADCVIDVACCNQWFLVFRTVWHEVIHYQQFRDKQKLTEKGMRKKETRFGTRLAKFIRKQKKK
jgi:hypothetical protein